MKYTLLKNEDAPITLQETKEYLAINHEYHDEMLRRLIKAAIRYSENYTGMSVTEKRWQVEATPAEIGVGFILAYNPVVEIDFIETLIDTKWTQIEKSQYIFQESETSSFIQVCDQILLSNAQENDEIFRIGFHVNPDPLSDALHQAVIMIVAWYYENRGDVSSEYNNAIPPEIAALLESERKGFL